MKRKSIFLLGAVLAGSALVGGTFAAWAVTDNAPQLDVFVTPGTIATDSDDIVTLEYGTKELINVEGLTAGATVGPYALGIKATAGKATSFSDGQLSVSIAGTGSETLINYVTVQVKTDEEVEKVVQRVTKLTLNKDNTSDIYYPSLTSGTEKKVYFYVTLSSDAVGTIYNTIKNQKLTLSVNWDIKEGTPVVTGTTYYFTKPAGWGNDIHVYAYKANGEENAAWPGVPMESLNAYYYVKLGNDYTTVVFNDKDGGHQTSPDIALSGSTAAKRYYNGSTSAWETTPTEEQLHVVTETEYYLVGNMTNWAFDANYKLTKEASSIVVPENLRDNAGVNSFTYTHKLTGIQFTQEKTVKIAGSDNAWYGEYSSDNSAANVTLGAGNYDVYFNTTKQGNIHILFIWSALSE